MATSGTYAYNPDFAELLDEVLQRVGINPTRATSYEINSAMRSFNLLMADWSNRELNLWTVAEISHMVTEATATITLSNGGIDVLDLSLRRDSKDTPLIRISREEYERLPNKTLSGRPSQYFVQRGQSAITITLWPVPENSTDEVRGWQVRRIQDAGSLSRTPDVPHRFLEALTAGWACKLSKKITNLSPDRIRILKQDYDEAWETAAGHDRDRGEFEVTPHGYWDG